MTTTLEWDGSLSSANTVIAAVNKHFFHEPEPAKLSTSGNRILFNVSFQELNSMAPGEHITLS